MAHRLRPAINTGTNTQSSQQVLFYNIRRWQPSLTQPIDRYLCRTKLGQLTFDCSARRGLPSRSDNPNSLLAVMHHSARGGMTLVSHEMPVAVRLSQVQQATPLQLSDNTTVSQPARSRPLPAKASIVGRDRWATVVVQQPSSQRFIPMRCCRDGE